MKFLPFLILLFLGCGPHIDTECKSTMFGSVKAVLLIDCDHLEYDENLIRQVVPQFTGLDLHTYESRAKRDQILVRNAHEWYGPDSSLISGITFTPINIETDKDEWSLLHETFHTYDVQGYMEDVGGLVFLPIFLINDMNHTGWDTNGYYTASDYYDLHYCPLEPQFICHY